MRKTTFILFVTAFIIGICISSCSTQKPTTPNPQCESYRGLQYKYDSITRDFNALKAEVNDKMTLGKYPLEIDEMLNIEDSTIFNENFKQYELIQVHPRSREMYQWVSNIHELDQLIKQIEKNHLSIDNINAEITNNLPRTTIQKLESLAESIKNDISEANDLKATIEESYYSDMKKIFTHSQMNYYENLTLKLGRYIDYYFKDDE